MDKIIEFLNDNIILIIVITFIFTLLFIFLWSNHTTNNLTPKAEATLCPTPKIASSLDLTNYTPLGSTVNIEINGMDSTINGVVVGYDMILVGESTVGIRIYRMILKNSWGVKHYINIANITRIY